MKVLYIKERRASVSNSLATFMCPFFATHSHPGVATSTSTKATKKAAVAAEIWGEVVHICKTIMSSSIVIANAKSYQSLCTCRVCRSYTNTGYTDWQPDTSHTPRQPHASNSKGSGDLFYISAAREARPGDSVLW